MEMRVRSRGAISSMMIERAKGFYGGEEDEGMRELLMTMKTDLESHEII